MTPWTVAHQAPLSLEFSRQEYWSRLPFPPPGDLPDPEIELKESTCQCRGHQTRVGSLGREGPLEEEMATCSIILAWRIPWTEEPGRLQFIGLQRVEHNWTNLVSTHIGKYQREETCLVNTGSLHGESHSRFVHYRRFAVVVVVQLLSCVRLFVI